MAKRIQAWSASYGWNHTREWNNLPKVPGCYLVLLDGAPLYAGKAHNLRKRFYLHQIGINRICGKDFHGDISTISVVYLPLPVDALDDVERDLIHAFRPTINTCFNRGLK